MTPKQAEVLLRLVENRYDEGDGIISEMRRMGAAHAQHLLEDEQMLIKALEINRQDQERFASYSPRRPAQPIGPQAGAFSKPATPRTLTDQQRAAITSPATTAASDA